jgi:hypothetical protein
MHPCGFSPGVIGLQIALHTSESHGFEVGSCAAEISCTRRSATRCFEPRTTGPVLRCLQTGNAHGIFEPFAVFLCPQVPVFNAGMLGYFTTCRDRSSTVHPHMPLSFMHFAR